MKVISENYMQKFIVYQYKLSNWKKVITLVLRALLVLSNELK